MKSIIALAILAVVAVSAHLSNAQTSGKRKDGVHIVGTEKLAATLSAGNARERITGRVSISLTSNESGPRDQLKVSGFNVVFFGVSQKTIAPKGCPDDQLGAIGFATLPGKLQTLRFDARRSQITGQLEMSGDASVLNSLLPAIHDNDGDLVATPKLITTATIRIDLETPFNDRFAGAMTTRATLQVSLHTRGARFRNFEVSSFSIASNANTLLNLDLAVERFFEVVRKLCVQPVSIFFVDIDIHHSPTRFYYDSSGDGLAFGEPGARSQWEKADVVFDIRPWKTVQVNALLYLQASEIDRLRASVDDDDCIEVFFVKAFSPMSETVTRGGGTTFGCGANSKIISSDENVVGGIDLTHLAHEFGHVLGLDHPDVSSAGFYSASTGTLMCKSGFLRDNPRVNSQENKDNLANPLLVFSLRLAGGDVDCLDSVDCGRCR